MKKKLFILLAVLAMMLLMVPMAFAAEVVDSGTCGENLTWVLTDDGTLTISGEGEMDTSHPWYEYSNQITHIIIEYGVTTISDFAFEDCANLTHIDIPDSIVKIYAAVFRKCQNLQSINIPASVEYLGYSSFADCSSLEGIWVDENNENYTSDASGVLFDKNRTSLLFAPNALKGDYVIPDTVVAINDIAFQNCELLTSISIPYSVTDIRYYYQTFYNCSSLNGIWVDEKNTKFSSDSQGVLYNKEKSYIYYVPDGITGSYSVPESVLRIANSAFANCINLTNIIIPDSVIYIDDSAFHHCTSLTNISIPDSTADFESSYAFWGCANLTNVKFPNQATYIGESTFRDCVALTHITVPDSITSIWREAFSGCTSLSKIYIPISVTKISYYAFANCTNLSDVYYEGTEEQWSLVEYPLNEELLNANIHFSHIHTYTANVVNSTCEQQGYSIFSCECADQYIGNYTEATGHTFGPWNQVTAPTTNSEGLEQRKCACGETEQRAIDKLPPTATEPAPSEPTDPEPTHNFTDVVAGSFYEEAVIWAVENEVTTGRTSTTFAPGESCKRSEVVTFLHRAEDKPASAQTDIPFTDVETGRFYTDAVLWAVEEGITNGMGDGTFGVDLSCTRAQVVTFLWRTAGCPAPASSEHPFTDLNEDAFYFDAVLWAVEQGITNGVTPTTFGPENTCTRGQIVTFLHRFAG